MNQEDLRLLRSYPILIVYADEKVHSIARQCDLVGLMSFLSSSIADAVPLITTYSPFVIIIDARLVDLNGHELIDRYWKLRPSGGHVILLNPPAHNSVPPEQWPERFGHTFWKCNDNSVEPILREIAAQKLVELRQELNDLREISTIFVDEAQEILRDLSQQILKLEENDEAMALDILLRRVHTLKGAAVSLPEAEILATLAHHFETALSFLKTQKIKASPTTIDLFLSTANLCQDLLGYISQHYVPPLETIFQVRLQHLRLQQIENQANGISGLPSNLNAFVSNRGQKTDPRDKEQRTLTISDMSLDQLTRISADLVIIKNGFQQITAQIENGDDINHLRRKIQDHSYLIHKISGRLQDQVMSIRQVSLQQIFNKIPGMIRQLSHDLNKKVSVEIHGETIRVDKNIAATLNGCLTHLIRNAIDHGIELPEERRLKDKMVSGQLTIIASQMDQNLFVRIMDDGRGIDPQKVRDRVLECGLSSIDELNRLNQNQIIDFLFLPGFSTVKRVTNISGRGIGMDFIKSEVEKMGGSVRLESEKGRGTTVIIQLPLQPKSVVIEHGVLIQIQHTMVAIPLNAITEIAVVEKRHLSKCDSVYQKKYLDKTIPLLQWNLLIESQRCQNGMTTLPPWVSTVTLLSHDQHVAIIADGIENQIEMVVYPFNPMIRHPRCFRGTTLLTDDRVAFVVDPDHLASIAATYDFAEAL